MRLLLVLALFAAACGGSKKSASAPAPAEGATGDEMRDQSLPDDPDDPNNSAADPCDGGE